MSTRCEMFAGFSKNTISFLKKLAKNNNKDWFDANKPDYLKYVKQPTIELTSVLADRMLSIDNTFESNPSKIISRINRDIRFSANKSPYRSNIWFSFKPALIEWFNHPGFYFEFDTLKYGFGMGFYKASKETLDEFKESVVENPKEFQEVIKYNKLPFKFQLYGKEYKRPKKFEVSDELQTWLNRTNFYVACSFELDDVFFSEHLAQRLIQGFELLQPLYDYFKNIVRQS